jgi:hypothetical protein
MKAKYQNIKHNQNVEQSSAGRRTKYHKIAFVSAYKLAALLWLCQPNRGRVW